MSYFDSVLGYPAREALMLECPALLLLCVQHVLTGLLRGRRVADPLAGAASPDTFSELMAAPSPEALFARLEAGEGPLWVAARSALEAGWGGGEEAREADPPGGSPPLLLCIAGDPQFYSPGLDLTVSTASLRNTLGESRRLLRGAAGCALAGSTESLDKRDRTLGSVLHLARLVPPPNTAAEGQVTSEGLHFCMMPLQRQWWTLVSAAVDRALLFAQQRSANAGGSGTQRVTRPLLWQLMAVISCLDCSRCAHSFPTQQASPAAFELLARLREVGLVYPLMVREHRCFLVSPHYAHALGTGANAPLSIAAVAGDGTQAPEAGQQPQHGAEDVDTIITETNFRLYVYSTNPDLLSIVGQFAAREEVVDGVLACFRVTRQSFAAALAKGISARQVLLFLSLRAHPSMLARYSTPSGPGAATDGTPAASGSGQEWAAGDDATAGAALAVPQSFCDQLFMWEKERTRVMFERDVVMLSGATAEQQAAVEQLLRREGELSALVHRDSRGVMIVREAAYERLLAPLIGTSTAGQ